MNGSRAGSSRRFRSANRRNARNGASAGTNGFCWIEIALVKVGQWVTRVVCEVVNIALDAVGGVLGLIFAIPGLGRLLREIWNFVLDIFWRIVGLFGGRLAGLARPRLGKKVSDLHHHSFDAGKAADQGGGAYAHKSER